MGKSLITSYIAFELTLWEAMKQGEMRDIEQLIIVIVRFLLRKHTSIASRTIFKKLNCP